MEELDKKIQNVMKMQIQEPMGYEQRILNTIRNYKTSNFGKNKGRFIIKRRIIAAICASFILISGVVVATNIKNNKKSDRGLGEGVDTAIENGYIETPNKEFISVDNIGAKVTIENFLMDDVNLSVNFVLQFDETIKDVVNLENIKEVDLKNLIVRDEGNRIIYCNADEETFTSYCKEYNLDYIYEEFNDNYINTGVTAFIESKSSDFLKLMYNMYSDGFPKSKKLYFSFNGIEIIEYENEIEKQYVINGYWYENFDVPKEMYNRTEEHYRVITCDNKDINVYTAKVTNTGFEIGVIISNIERPEFDKQKYDEFIVLSKAYNKREISYEEFEEIAKWYYNLRYLNYPISTSTDIGKYIGEETFPSYVENEIGEKFECNFSPSRRCKNHFLEGNKFDFYETFNMVKNNSTQNIKVVLYYYGQPVTIELEKIDNTIGTRQPTIQE